MDSDSDIDELCRRKEDEDERLENNRDLSFYSGISVVSSSTDVGAQILSQPQDPWLQSLRRPRGWANFELPNETPVLNQDSHNWYEQNKQGIREFTKANCYTSVKIHSNNLSTVRCMPNCDEQIAESYRNLGICARHMNHHLHAIKYFENLLSLATKNFRDRSLEYAALYYLEDTINKFLLEKNCFNTVEMWAINRIDLITREKNEIASTKIQQSQLCKSSYDDAVEIHESTFNNRSIANQYALRMLNYLELGDLHLAFNYPHRAIKIYKRIRHAAKNTNDNYKRRALYKLCQIYTDLNELPEATMYNCLFAKECEKYNDRLGMKRSKLIMAKLSCQVSDFKAALIYAKEYRYDCIRLEDRQGQQTADNMIRHLPSDLPLNSQFLGAINQDINAITYSENVNRKLEKIININCVFLPYIRQVLVDKRAEFQSLIHLSICLIEKAKFNEAIHYLSNALELANILDSEIYQTITLIIFLDMFDKIASKYNNHNNREFYRCAVNESKKYRVKLHEALTKSKYASADDLLKVERRTDDVDFPYKDVLKTYNDKILSAIDSGDHYEEMYSRMIIGEIYYLLQKYGMARHHYNFAVNLAQLNENSFIESCIIHKFHLIYERSGAENGLSEQYLMSYLIIAENIRLKKDMDTAFEYAIQKYGRKKEYKLANEIALIYRNHSAEMSDLNGIHKAKELIAILFDSELKNTNGNSGQTKRKNYKDHADNRKKVLHNIDMLADDSTYSD